MSTSRRQFLTTSAALLAGASAGAGAALADVKPPSTTDDVIGANGTAGGTITDGTIVEASKLAGLDYSQKERSQLLRTIGDLLRDAQSHRGLTLANGAQPGVRFDPRLPGREFRAQSGGITLSAPSTAPLPATDADIAYAPLTQLSAWIKSGAISSQRLTALYLKRLREIGPRLNCVVTINGRRALETARQRDAELAAGNYRGPLHGIPYGLKDLLDTAGITTTWGAAPYKDRLPETDATVVSRLDEAGGVLVAKLSLGALALDDIWFGGKTLNPWNLREGSSGSSAGPGAAVAAGLVGFALGTETLGSIIAPSMRCGVTGLRPTFGRVSRHGAMALCWSLDKIGPMTRRIEDAALVLGVINGFDAKDAGSIDAAYEFDAGAAVRGARIGYAPAWFEGPGVTATDRAALGAVKDAGMKLVEIDDFPPLPYAALLSVIFAESAAAFSELTLSGRDDLMRRQDDSGWPNTFRQSRFLSAVDLLQAERVRRLLMVAMDEKMKGLDALISPSFADPLLVATNYTGHPSLTLRAGMVKRPTRSNSDDPGPDPGADTPGPLFTEPHGITLWGPLFEEGRLANIGMALERRFDVWHLRPPVG